MTQANYNEMASYCVDLLVAAGFVSRGHVASSGRVVFTTTEIGEEVGFAVAQLIRAADQHPGVSKCLQRLLMAEEMAEKPEAFTDTLPLFQSQSVDGQRRMF